MKLLPAAGCSRRGLVAALAVAALPACAPRAPRGRWPDLAVRDLGGRPRLLPSDTGRPRLVNLWALWCAPCRRELPALQRLGRAYAARDVDVLGIALADEVFAIREFLAQQRLVLPVAVLAPRAPALLGLHVQALPQTFVVSRAGAVLARWSGARDWDAASVRGELDAALEA